MAHEPLRVTLADIRNASTKGKWWIVGAAWAGDPVRERERARQAALAEKAAKDKNALLSNGKGGVAEDDEEDETDLIGLGTGQQEELLKLARKQGMNTDVRRQVFMVMMTSDVSRSSECSWYALITSAEPCLENIRTISTLAID
jgi:nucleolar MIF4G domain-containing protein 1